MNVPENEPKEPRSVTLLLHCPLRPGLAAGLTQFIYTHGGLILYHEQYVDTESAHYYTRLKWDVSSFSTTDAEMAERLRSGEWTVEVPVIVSNHADLEPVARRFGVEFRSFSITKENKSEVEDEQLALLQSHRIDVVVLARYMQILT